MRLEGVCNHDSNTVVLAHIRRGGVAGIGQKPADLIGCYACSACHDEIDRRTRHYPTGDLHPYVLDALCRTLDAVVREGLVK